MRRSYRGCRNGSVAALDWIALPILQQLESDGLVTADDHGFTATWTDVHAIIRHREYQGATAELQIPGVEQVAPSLGSVGTLSDPEFGISIVGWTDTDGRPVNAEQVGGAILKIDGAQRLMPEGAWHVTDQVTRFWKRTAAERTDIANRRGWGQI